MKVYQLRIVNPWATYDNSAGDANIEIETASMIFRSLRDAMAYAYDALQECASDIDGDGTSIEVDEPRWNTSNQEVSDKEWQPEDSENFPVNAWSYEVEELEFRAVIYETKVK